MKGRRWKSKRIERRDRKRKRRKGKYRKAYRMLRVQVEDMEQMKKE
jgi:hypothetical protein